MVGSSAERANSRKQLPRALTHHGGGGLVADVYSMFNYTDAKECYRYMETD